jgi:hypothetical protein
MDTREKLRELAGQTVLLKTRVFSNDFVVYLKGSIELVKTVEGMDIYKFYYHITENWVDYFPFSSNEIKYIDVRYYGKKDDKVLSVVSLIERGWGETI